MAKIGSWTWGASTSRNIALVLPRRRTNSRRIRIDGRVRSNSQCIYSRPASLANAAPGMFGEANSSARLKETNRSFPPRMQGAPGRTFNVMVTGLPSGLLPESHQVGRTMNVLTARTRRSESPPRTPRNCDQPDPGESCRARFSKLRKRAQPAARASVVLGPAGERTSRSADVTTK